VNLIVAGIGSVLLTAAVADYASGVAARVEDFQDRAAAGEVLDTTQRLRRYIQDQYAALKGRVADGPVRIDPADLMARGYLPPYWGADIAHSQRMELAVVTSSEGDPVGYVYTVSDDIGRAGSMSRALTLRLGDGTRAGFDATRRFMTATALASGELPTPAENGLAISTGQLRNAASRMWLSRFPEPDDSAAMTMAGSINAGGHNIGNVKRLEADGVSAISLLTPMLTVSGTISIDAANNSQTATKWYDNGRVFYGTGGMEVIRGQ
jgi:hypothetical protein